MLDLAKPVIVKIANAARYAVAHSANGVRALQANAKTKSETIDNRLGRVVFGNTSGLANNIEGWRNMRAARRGGTTTDHPLAEQLRRQGYARAPGLIDLGRLAPAVAQFNLAIEDPALSKSGTNPFFHPYGLEAIRSIPDPAKALPQIASWLEGGITEIVSAYYGSPFICLLAFPYRTYHVPTYLAEKLEPISNRWHCDNRRTDILKVFVLLRDTDESMGPLHVISLADTRTALQRGYRTRNDTGAAGAWMDSRAIRHTGKAGDAVFCNTCLALHRAGIPAEGKSRDMIEMRFLPAAQGPGKDWMKHMDLTAGD